MMWAMPSRLRLAGVILHELQRDGSIWKSVENFCLDAILPPYIWGNLDIPFASKTMQKKGVRHCVVPLKKSLQRGLPT